MKRPLKPLHPLLGVGLPLLAMVALFLLLAFSLQRLYSIQAHMRLEAPHNMLWVVSRAQLASMRLTNAVGQRVGNQIDATELQREYAIFMSRLNLLEQGPQRRQLQLFGVGSQLDALNAGLPGLELAVLALQPRDWRAAKAVELQLAPYNTLLGQAATKAMVAGWDDIGGRLDDVREQIWQIIASLIGILLAGMALSLHALLAIREARERTRLLNQEKAFSQLLIASSGEIIIAVDLKSKCTIWNPAAEQLFACAPDSALGYTLGSISGFFQVNVVKQAVREALHGRTTELLDQPFFPAGQEEARYVDLRSFALYENERIIGSVLLIFDVTERRAAQREIAMHRDHLEELVRARTQELDAALERERATAELYRNFGTMVSHQFRTPLTIIDSALQRLVRRSDRLTAAEIRDRSARARAAIKRLDAGQVQVDSQPCDFGLLATGVCKQQRDATAGRVINLTVSNDPPPVACADPTHVEHILNNLVANALKYSAPGSPVTVVVRCVGDHVECAVTNQAVLAHAGDLEQLFERYRRGQNAKGHTGIGIGLYMARALARLQNGDVFLDYDEEGIIQLTLQLPRMTNVPSLAPQIAGGLA